MDIYSIITFTGVGLGLIGLFIIEVLVPRKKKALQRGNKRIPACRQAGVTTTKLE